MQLDTRFVKIAHDPGDPVLCSHCPFCGSGQITGRSDGGIDCAFCGQSFIVRVQPAFPGMPQAPGMGAPTDVGPDMGAMPPGMEGEEGMPPGMEGEEGEGVPPGGEGEGGGPPFGEEGEEGEEEAPGEEEEEGENGEEGSPPVPPRRKTSGLRMYRTVTGDLLPEDAYVRHLAILHSGRSPVVMALVRQAVRDEVNHEDMTGPELRAHMRHEHGFQDSPDDPDWLVDQTHREEHADGDPSHRHPDLEQWDEEPPLSDKDWMHQHGIEARRQAYLTTGDTPEHRAHYDRGYSASEGWDGYPDEEGHSPLEHADFRGEPDSWYQGYMDHATDRPYGHAIECAAHDHDGPGCTLWDQPEKFDPAYTRQHDTAWLSEHRIRGSRRNGSVNHSGLVS